MASTTLNNPLFTGTPMVPGAQSTAHPLAAILQALSGVMPLTGMTKLPPAMNQAGPISQPFVGDFSGGLPTPSLPSIPGFNPMSLFPTSALPVLGGGVNALQSIIEGIQAGDRLAMGPDPATASGPPPLLPLSHEKMMQELGYAPPPADTGGLSIPFDINAMPRPPVYEAPPEVDMDELQSAKRSNILGSLAAGAAQVDPASGGSFARALASAGGAGASAAGEMTAKMAKIAHDNALAAYQVSMKNKELEYEFEGKKYEMMLPNIKATDDSVIVQEFDPASKAYKVRVIKTGGVLEDADKLKKYIEAMDAPGPAAEATAVQYIAGIYKDDPVAAKTTLTRMAIERSILNGAGAAVFGDKYQDAEEEGAKRVPIGLQQDPEAYQKAHAKAVTAVLLSDPTTMSDLSWLTNAAKYGSVAATILTQGNGGQSLRTDE